MGLQASFCGQGFGSGLTWVAVRQVSRGPPSLKCLKALLGLEELLPRRCRQSSSGSW